MIDKAEGKTPLFPGVVFEYGSPRRAPFPQIHSCFPPCLSLDLAKVVDDPKKQGGGLSVKEDK